MKTKCSAASNTRTLVLFLLGLAVGMQRAALAQEVVLFRDDFSGSLATNWTILHRDDAYWTVGPSNLNLRACGGDISNVGNDYKNLFVIDAPTRGDYTVTARVSFEPVPQSFPQVDLVAYDDDDNLVRCIYGHIYGRRSLEFGAEIGGAWAGAMEVHDFGSSPFYLRLEKTDNSYRQLWSLDGVSFTAANRPIIFGNGRPAKIGFAAMVDPTESSVAYVDYFEVRSPILSSLAIRFSQVELCWDTVPNAWYQLQYRSGLTTNEWVPFTAGWLAGTGAAHCTNDTVQAGPAERFYRVVAVTNSPPQP